MDSTAFFTSSRLLIVAGKGGVGKTTVAATLARQASRAGLRTVLIEVEGKSGLSTALGVGDLSFRETVVEEGDDTTGRLTARLIEPDKALLHYLDNNGFTKALRRVTGAGALEFFAQTTPGLKDVIVLGQIKQIERSEDVDLVILDAPASGHAISFLRSAHGILEVIDDGPIRQQAQEVVDMLTDPDRCRVVLVTLPEETPINELTETAFALEEDIDIALGPTVVNGVWQPLDGLDRTIASAARSAKVKLEPAQRDALAAAGAFRLARLELQREQLERFAEELPLEQLRLPQLPGNRLDPDDLHELVDAMADAIAGLPEPA